MSVNEKLTAIADNIRRYSTVNGLLTLDDMADSILSVSNYGSSQGYAVGYNNGYDAGYEAGKSGGGGSDNVSGIFMAEITPATDLSYLTVKHNLGTTDILLAACFAETLGEVSPGFNGSLAKFWGRSSIPTQRSGTGFNVGYYWQTTNSYAVGAQPSSASTWDSPCGDENSFTFFKALTNVSNWIAGVTYKVIIMAASAFEEG